MCKFLEPERIYYCRRTTISQVNLMGGCVLTWAGGGSLVPGPLVLGLSLCLDYKSVLKERNWSLREVRSVE